MSNVELNEKQIVLVKKVLEKSCFDLGYENKIEPCVCVEKENRIFDLILETSGSSIDPDSKRFSFCIFPGEPRDGKSILYFTILVHNKFSYNELFSISGVFYGDSYIEVKLRINSHLFSKFSLLREESSEDVYLLNKLN